MRLHPDEGLADGDKADDMQHPLVHHLLRQKQPLLGKGGQHHLIYIA